MDAIEIISASAGSGKTYTLSTLLHDAIAGGAVRPEAVIATTFTNKAAAELQERVRARLLQSPGQAEAANRLGAARMGTVNAVCGRLLSDFAFELGLRPDLKVLDPDLAGLSLQRALSDVVDDAELSRLAELEGRMPAFVWRADVQRVLDFARTNVITPAELAASAERSVLEVLGLLGEAGDGAAFDAQLAAALESFIASVENGPDETKTTATALALARDALSRIRRGQVLPWSEWIKLSSLTPAVKSSAFAVPVHEAAANHDRHPQLRADLADAIRIVYGIAARALEAYDAYKRAWGSIDFVDQEVLALRLLRDPQLRSRLEGEIDLVLVDEFQDSSPLQLAIFLELAHLARKSVWVGDQKQAIYGFRGTDPALMDAAIAAVLGGQEPRTLGKSHRSRPELVRVTSDLFAPSFARHGLPETRVRLEPAEPNEPAGLGSIAERWVLVGRNQGQRQAEVAALVRQMLGDPEVRVRDRVTGEARRVRPGDVAVLSCKNDTCAAIAQELSALGIRAVLPRPGLLATHEGQAVLAALRLWVDPHDSLAMAQLAQITEWAGRPDEWLAAAVREPGGAAFEELPIVQRIRARREAQPLAGSVASFDAAIDAADLRELCLRWGDSDARQANLDALRAHAVAHESRCAEQGIGCTAASLVSELETRAAAGLDEQAFFNSDDAVVLATWHRSKGLEWPVTVLFELEGMREDDGLGVRVVSDGAFDLACPLAGRWIRYWPHPYDPAQRGKAPFHHRVEDHPALGPVREQDERQRLRLFYVGWTRARDRLVLAAQAGKLASGMPALLADDEGPLLAEPEGGEARWADRTVRVVRREATLVERAALSDEPGAGYVRSGPKVYPPAFVRPSALHAAGVIGEPISIGNRAPLSGKPDMNHLGEAVHAYLGAADVPAEERVPLAANALRRWGVPGALQPADVVRMRESLERWVSERWPSATWRREWPVMQRLPDGSVLRGTIDLLLETADGLVVIDHKSFPGDRDQALERARSHAGQLGAYADAVARASGRPVVARFIHLPVSGWVVPVEPS